MFDNICKFLAENFSTDFATWLLGEPISLTELSPSELSLEPIRADALILLESAKIVLHLEFQTHADANIPFRMIDYRLRVYRRFPQKQMRQVVIYLKETSSELVQQNTFNIAGTRHEFEVVRLWEQPTEVFLRYPGLFPLAVLGGTDDRASRLQQVAQEIIAIPDQRLQSNVAAATAILAGLVLEKGLIQRVLRRDYMRESVIYQEIEAEAKAEGRAEGKAEGKAEGIRLVAVNLLKSQMPLAEVIRVTGLSLEEAKLLRKEIEGESHNS
ncbi:Rpn family recombination-promoting nuclease/putative transposase [Nostoc sp.]|uniref:Rpn family recombination-promoting nuclease/putative transposase n=1 Tax=Nostoc sp. TaxID=1180 RepID=UPI002FF4A2D5